MNAVSRRQTLALGGAAVIPAAAWKRPVGDKGPRHLVLRGDITVEGSLTVAGSTTFDGLVVANKSWTGNGPVTVNSDGNDVALRVNGAQADSNQQLFEVFDRNGAPITSVPPYGGPGVYGDNFRIFPPGDVFNASYTVWYNGSITLNQRNGGCTLYSGADDPNAVPPNNEIAPGVTRPYRNGDRYLQTAGGYHTWVYVDGAWVAR